MVPASHVLAFAALVTVLIAIPGPSVLFTISRALTVGRRSALLSVAGNELGLYAQVIAVAFGVGALVQRSAQVFTIVKWAGAAYLVLLGVQAIRHRQSMAEALAAQVTPVRPLRAVRDGFVIGATNPKTIVFFVGGCRLPGLPGRRVRPGQHVGGRRGHRPAVVRPLTAQARADRRHRPQGLTGPLPVLRPRLGLPVQREDGGRRAGVGARYAGAARVADRAGARGPAAAVVLAT